MAEVNVPQKALLDAETDRALALVRDNRPGWDTFTVALADDMAAQIREQFGPGHGRIVMVVAQALGCIEKVMREDHGAIMSSRHLLIIAALAAEQLDREHPS